ncbi:unnamed protein product, partial [Durusdinium trenchii]
FKTGFAAALPTICHRAFIPRALSRPAITAAREQRPGNVLLRRILPSLPELSSSLSSCIWYGRWNEALGALYWARSLHVNPDAVCYNVVISAAGKNVRWPVAITVFHLMRQQSAEPTVSSHNAAISAFSLALHWALALDTLKFLRHLGPKAERPGFGATLKACSAAAQWRHSIVLMQEMQQSKVAADMQAMQDLQLALEVIHTRHEKHVPPMLVPRQVAMVCGLALGQADEIEMKGVTFMSASLPRLMLFFERERPL